MTNEEMTEEELEDYERGHRHGEIPMRPEEGASEAYMQSYWAALRGAEEPKLTLQERLAAYKEKKRQGQK